MLPFLPKPIALKWGGVIKAYNHKAGYQCFTFETEGLPQPTNQPVTSQPFPSVRIVISPQTDTSNWKTFTTDYYSFKYPSDWVVAPQLKSCDKGIESTTSKMGMSWCDPLTKYDTSLKEVVQGFANKKTLLSSANLVIDSHAALKVESLSKGNPQTYEEEAFINNVEYAYSNPLGKTIISGVLPIYFYPLDGNEYQKAKIIYDGILATFKIR